MNGYTKLFTDIITSSIWNEDDKTRVVWITMLALSNADGFVTGAPTSLAILARVPPEDCKKALARLSSADPESRTSDNQGRRIEAVEGGWIILNYAKHRERVSDDPHAIAARERQRKHRSKKDKRRKCDSHVTSRYPASASASASACISSSPEGECEGGISAIVTRVRNIRPEFRVMREVDILNALKAGPKEVWEEAITKLDQTWGGALECPTHPHSILRNYISALAAERSGSSAAEDVKDVSKDPEYLKSLQPGGSRYVS